MMRRMFLWVVVVLALGCSGACSGGGEVPGTALGLAPVPTVDPNGSAVDALPAVSAPPVSGADLAGDVLLTRLSVVLEPDARVRELEAAAAAVGATGLSFSRPGSLFLDLALPRQDDLVALQALADRLKGQPGILFAEPGMQFAIQVLPPPEGAPVDKFELTHLLPTRFPAAWNVRRLAEASSARVPVLVADSFAGPRTNFDVQMEGSASAVPEIEGRTSRHGYQVAGTVAARFDGLQSHGANPSPRRLSLQLVQREGLTRHQGLAELFTQIEATEGPIIVNLSVGFNYEADLQLFGATPARARDLVFGHYLDAIQWAELSQDAAFLDRALLVVAAGNNGDGVLVKDYPGLRSALLSSPFALATALDDLEGVATDSALWNPTGGSLGDLRLTPEELADVLQAREETLQGRPVSGRNVLTVGSVTSSENFDNLVASEFSNLGPDMFAAAEGVETITESGQSSLESGTSFAAPQVAGLASYLWLLDDSLRSRPVATTIGLLRATSRRNVEVSGVVDAYGAVLALDARRGDTRMRREILDVSGPEGKPDAKFDEFDLQRFDEVYGLAAPRVPANPSTRDYSRHDLNGDGFTGGTRKAALDLDAAGLDADGAPILNQVQVQVEGSGVTLDEEAVTDLDVLKFYAYATDSGGQPLFYDTSGPDALSERARILGGAEPSAVRVTVVGTSPNGTRVRQFEPSCVDDPTQVEVFAPDPETPLPLTLTAAETRLEIVSPTPDVVHVNLSTVLGPIQFCPDGGTKRDAIQAFVVLAVEVRERVRVTDAETPDSFQDLLPGRHVLRFGTIHFDNSGDETLVVDGMRLVTLTFTRLP